VTVLKADWVVEGSVLTTLHNLIKAGDIAYLKTVQPEHFEQLLIKELRFLALYEGRERTEAEEYIHRHRTELYRFLHALPSTA
jgi:hypothetical protein